MKFKDWRQKNTTPSTDEQAAAKPRLMGQQFYDHIDQLIHDAQAEGKFDNLAGAGKPLALDDDEKAGDNVLTYRVMKNEHILPPELLRVQQVRDQQERITQEITRVKNQHTLLLQKRFLSPEVKSAQNRRLEQAIERYRSELADLNSKILTINLTAPSAMHMATINIEERVARVRSECPFLV